MSKVYQIITDRVVELLESGTVPWHRSWGGKWQWPRNLVSGNCYRGINVFLTGCQGYSSPYWLTFKQAQKLGGNVKKGEKGTQVVFWKQWERENKETGTVDKLPVLRYFTVFHASQCEGVQVPETETPQNDFTPIEQCERAVAQFELKPSIRHDFDKAFYRPNDDLVGMPAREAFDAAESYYSVLFHELTHSTGHSSRLNRKEISESIAAFGSEDYGREELVAEMGAAFMCGHCGIEQQTINNSAAYVAGWLKTIRKDAKLVIQAASAAQKAADHMLGIKNGS